MTAVVLFDLDDTLFAHRAAVDAGIVAHLAATGAELPDAEAMWHAIEEQHYPRYLAGELDFLQQRRVRVRALTAGLGLDLAADDAADAWYGAYYREYVRAWALHDDALRCLDALAAHGIRVGIITNGERDPQSEKLAAVALADRVEHAVFSGELGVAKPDARIFGHAVALFGVEPAAAAYVGDRLHTDAIGATNAGLTGVWIDRRGTASPDESAEAAAAGVHVIRGLDALPAVLGLR